MGIGSKIEKCRNDLNLSRREFVERSKIDINQYKIARIENNIYIPSDEEENELEGAIKLLYRENEFDEERENSDEEGEHEEDTDEEEETDDEEDDDLEVDSIIPSEIGRWLNERRIEKNWTAEDLAKKTGLSIVTIYNIESGRSQNPQANTVRKLEEAFGNKVSRKVKENAKDASNIEGIGQWSDFDPNNDEEWPEGGGVYVLYDISNRPMYVGQGQNISRRMHEHRQKFWFKRPIIEYASYLVIKQKGLREQVERILIKFLRSNAVLNYKNVDR